MTNSDGSGIQKILPVKYKFPLPRDVPSLPFLNLLLDVAHHAIRQRNFRASRGHSARALGRRGYITYTGVTKLELRCRLALLSGGRYTDFGERPNDWRAELRLRYFF